MKLRTLSLILAGLPLFGAPIAPSISYSVYVPASVVSTVPVWSHSPFIAPDGSISGTIYLPQFVVGANGYLNVADWCGGTMNPPTPNNVGIAYPYPGLNCLSRQGSVLGLMTLGLTFTVGPFITQAGIVFPSGADDGQNDVAGGFFGTFSDADVTTFGTYTNNGLTLTVADPPTTAPEPASLTLTAGMGMVLVGIRQRLFKRK